jgi:GLPGLI family protein
MKKRWLLILFVLASPSVFAQFLTQGKITFERKTNLRQKMQTESESEWVKEHIKEIAQFTISDFTLLFNKEAASYQFDKEKEVTGMRLEWSGPQPAHENKVFTDYTKAQLISQKNVYEKDYLLEETMPRFQWKIENEMRMIAGYPCRKAVTKICDSVVVVAFYCDQIMVSGGPEGFNGLPGMILGIAIPRLYTTWFATEVDVLPQELSPFKPGKKSKKSTMTELISEVQKSTKDWGNGYGSKLIWWITL